MANNWVIRDSKAVSRVVEVSGAYSEKKRIQDFSLLVIYTAGEPITNTILDLYVLRPVGKVVQNSCGEVMVHIFVLLPWLWVW